MSNLPPICYGHAHAPNVINRKVDVMGADNKFLNKFARSFGRTSPAVRMAFNRADAIRKIGTKISSSNLWLSPHSRLEAVPNMEDIKAQYAEVMYRALYDIRDMINDFIIEINEKFTGNRISPAKANFVRMSANMRQGVYSWMRDTLKPSNRWLVDEDPLTDLEKSRKLFSDRGFNSAVIERLLFESVMLPPKYYDESLKRVEQIYKDQEGAFDVIVKHIKKMRTRYGEAYDFYGEQLKKHGYEIRDKNEGKAQPSLPTLGEQVDSGVVYDTSVWRANEAEAKRILLDEFGKTPDEGFISTYFGLSKEDFNKLGDEPVSVKAEIETPIHVISDEGVEIAFLGDVEGGSTHIVDEEQGKILKEHIIRYYARFNDHMVSEDAKKRIDDLDAEIKDVGARLKAVRKIYDKRVGNLFKNLKDTNEASALVRVVRKEITKHQNELSKKTISEADKAKLGEKLKKLNEYLEELKATAGRQKELKKELKAAIKEGVDAATRIKEGKKHNQKLIKRYLKKVDTDIHESAVERIVNLVKKISNGGKDRLDKTLLAEMKESDRLKPRTMWEVLSDDARAKLIHGGFLRRDIITNSYQQAEEISAHLAMMDAFGYKNKETANFIFNELVQQIKHEGELQIHQLKQQGFTKDSKEVSDIRKELESGIEDIRGQLQRLLGITEGAVNTDDLLYHAGKNLMNVAYTAHGSHFLWSALADFATLTLNNGFRIFDSKQIYQAMTDITKGISHSDAVEASYVAEMVLATAAKRFGAGMVDNNFRGAGGLGTPINRLTTQAHRLTSAGATMTSITSGMAHFNKVMKIIAINGFQKHLINIIENLDDYIKKFNAGDKKVKRELYKLTQLGLGKDELYKIAEEMKINPAVREGRHIPQLGMSRWKDDNLKRVVIRAFQSHSNRSVLTPAVGDIPHFMSNAMAKMIFQYWSHSFTFVSKVILPIIQESVVSPNMELVFRFSTFIYFGAVVVAVKDLIKYGEVRERSGAEWSHDIIDRSGLLSYMSAPTSFALKIAGESGSERWRAQGGAELATGASGSVINALYGATSGAVRGDTERVARNAAKLAPFRAQAQIFSQLFGLD